MKKVTNRLLNLKSLFLNSHYVSKSLVKVEILFVEFVVTSSCVAMDHVADVLGFMRIKAVVLRRRIVDFFLEI